MFGIFKKKEEGLRLPGPNYNVERRTERVPEKKAEETGKGTGPQYSMRQVTRFFVVELTIEHSDDPLVKVHEELSRFGEQGWSLSALVKNESKRAKKVSYEIVLERIEMISEIIGGEHGSGEDSTAGSTTEPG